MAVSSAIPALAQRSDARAYNSPSSNGAAAALYAADILRSVYSDYASARTVGQHCLDARPKAKSEVVEYFDKIVEMFSGPFRNGEADLAVFKESLEADIGRDFLELRIRKVQGWVISHAEELLVSTIAWLDQDNSWHAS